MALLQDEDSFIIHSRLLHGQVGDNDEAWQLALEMGREFLPEETLFSAEPLAPEPVAPPAEEATFDLDFDLDSLAPVEPVKEAPEPSVAALPEEKVDDFSIDFELPEPQSEQAATDAIPSSEPADSPELADAGEFKLPDLNLGEMAVGGSDENVLDFTQPADEGGAAETSGLDDLNDLDEVGIKLNLARAYLDMGDGDGARSLIDEVLAEGSSRQREEAEGLLQQLA